MIIKTTMSKMIEMFQLLVDMVDLIYLIYKNNDLKILLLLFSSIKL